MTCPACVNGWWGTVPCSCTRQATVTYPSTVDICTRCHMIHTTSACPLVAPLVLDGAAIKAQAIREERERIQAGMAELCRRGQFDRRHIEDLIRGALSPCPGGCGLKSCAECGRVEGDVT